MKTPGTVATNTSFHFHFLVTQSHFLLFFIYFLNFFLLFRSTLHFSMPGDVISAFDSIWVSSDHDQILEVAKETGARTHRRSAETSSDQSSSIAAVLEFLQTHPGAPVYEIFVQLKDNITRAHCHCVTVWIVSVPFIDRRPLTPATGLTKWINRLSRSVLEIDVIGLVQCTSPFVEAGDLDEAVRKMKSGSDSVFSVRRSHALRWKETGTGSIRRINRDCLPPFPLLWLTWTFLGCWRQRRGG